MGRKRFRDQILARVLEVRAEGRQARRKLYMHATPIFIYDALFTADHKEGSGGEDRGRSARYKTTAKGTNALAFQGAAFESFDGKAAIS